MRNGKSRLMVFPLGFCAVVLAGLAVGQPPNAVPENRSNQDFPPNREQLNRWVEDLNDSSFLVRENARQHLAKAGGDAFDVLFENRNSSSLEVRLTVRELLAQIEVHWLNESDSPAVQNLMKGFQASPVETRISVINRLSWLAVDEAQVGFRRIMQFDTSSVVQDHAAVMYLNSLFPAAGKPNGPAVEDLRKYLRRQFGNPIEILSFKGKWCVQAMASVVLLSSAGNEKQNWEEGMKSLNRLLDVSVSARVPQGIVKRILEARWNLFSVAYRIAARSGESLDDLDAIGFKLMSSQPETGLDFFLALLTENVRRGSMARLEREYEMVLRSRPVCRFSVAEYKRKTDGLESAISDLRPLIRQQIETGGDIRLLAVDLEESGLGFWAVFVLREKASIVSDMPAEELLYLAELEVRYGEVAKGKELAKQIIGNPRVQQNHGLKCCRILVNAAARQGDQVKEKEWLQKSIQFDPASADALARLWELAADADKVSIRKRVDNAIGMLRDRNRRGMQMRQSDVPAESSFGKTLAAESANELAILLSRTGGDLEYCLGLARSSVESDPYNHRFLETLADIYLALNQPDPAVESLRRAVRIRPIDKDIQRKLREIEGNF